MLTLPPAQALFAVRLGAAWRLGFDALGRLFGAFCYLLGILRRARRHVDVAAAEPFYFQRHFAVGNGIVTDIVAGAIVDLPIGPLVDADDQHQAAARLQL